MSKIHTWKNTFKGQIVQTNGTIVAAATTDLSTLVGNLATVSGNTTITSFGTVDEGAVFTLTFTGTPTITYNVTSLILPGAVSITAAAWDSITLKSLGSGNWRCIGYEKANGKAIVVDIQASTISSFTAWENITAWNAVRNWTVVVSSNINNESGSTAGWAQVWATSWAAAGWQTITITWTPHLIRIETLLQRVNSATGVLRLSVYSDAWITLVWQSTNTIDATTLTNSVSTWVTWNFSNEALSAGTYYLKLTKTTLTGSTVYVDWISVSWGSSYAWGIGYQINDSNVWTSLWGADLQFRVTLWTQETTTSVYKCDADEVEKIKFIGFSSETKTAGQAVKIDTSWVNSSQSGLTIWSTYYLSWTAGGISTSAGTNSVKVWKAVDTTKILIVQPPL